MKWINAAERLPENKKWNYIFRQARNSRSARVVYLDHAPNISAYMQLPIENIEWLDEAPDEKDKEIERLRHGLKRIEQMSDPGSYAKAVSEMKSIASDTLDNKA